MKRPATKPKRKPATARGCSSFTTSGGMIYLGPMPKDLDRDVVRRGARLWRAQGKSRAHSILLEIRERAEAAPKGWLYGSWVRDRIDAALEALR